VALVVWKGSKIYPRLLVASVEEVQARREKARMKRVLLEGEGAPYQVELAVLLLSAQAQRVGTERCEQGTALVIMATVKEAIAFAVVSQEQDAIENSAVEEEVQAV
jgi:hypothetical protein